MTPEGPCEKCGVDDRVTTGPARHLGDCRNCDRLRKPNPGAVRGWARRWGPVKLSPGLKRAIDALDSPRISHSEDFLRRCNRDDPEETP